MTRLDAFGVVVFDLDDTLYCEADYVRSGFRYVGELVERLYGVTFAEALMAAWEEGSADPIGQVLQAQGLSPALKEHLVAAYRYHRPTLSLNPGARELLESCRRRGCPLYLVSDGRGLTQRLKLDALGLLPLFDEVFISEEVGAGKPDPRAFQAIAARGGQGPWVYVADNPGKDFVAPNSLGWTTIGVRHTATRIHALAQSKAEPTFWVDELLELLDP